MKDDFKNVLISFGLIGLVFTQGSLMYQKKLLSEYIASTEVKDKKSLIIANQPPINTGNIIIKKPVNTQVNTNIPIKGTTSVSDGSNQQALDLAKAQADALARAEAEALAAQRAQIIADQQAQAQAQAASQSRISRAS